MSAAAYKLAEPTKFSVCGLVLMKEGKVAFLENLEELLPVDRLKGFFRVAEIDAQDAAVATVAARAASVAAATAGVGPGA